MGRRKIELKLISNRKRRIVTYQKRKKGLEKKAYELSTLCDVKVCLIMYGPNGNTENQTQEPNIWPQNPDFVSSMIQSYQDQVESNKKIRTQDLSTFYDNLAKKAEYERVRLHERKHGVEYPTWDERFDSMSASELRKVISELDVKVAAAKARIDYLLKGKRMVSQPPEKSNPPSPLVARRLVGTSSLQMGSIQHTSYDVSPMMNPGMMTMMNPVQYKPYNHDGHHLVAAEVRVTKNRVMMAKVEPMPTLLPCSQPAAVMRPYLQSLPPPTVPYGWNLPAAMIPYGQFQWMHYSDNVMRSAYHP